MIPTSHKHALSSLLSYPLGAKNVSDALDGVPQFDALSIYFSLGNENPHRIESPFLVLRVYYGKSVPSQIASNVMIERGWYDPKWRISVGAVPRRHAVKTALVGEGLLRARRWLLDHADVAGREGHAGISVRCDAEKERLIYESDSELR